MEKKFRLLDMHGNDVMGGLLSSLNPYVSCYGVPVKNGKLPQDLEVGESCKMVYNLSGQKPTEYFIKREE